MSGAALRVLAVTAVQVESFDIMQLKFVMYDKHPVPAGTMPCAAAAQKHFKRLVKVTSIINTTMVKTLSIKNGDFV